MNIHKNTELGFDRLQKMIKGVLGHKLTYAAVVVRQQVSIRIVRKWVR